MTTKEYIIELKKALDALEYHIFKTECFCKSCSECRMQMVCQYIIKFQNLIRVIENYD